MKSIKIFSLAAIIAATAIATTAFKTKATKTSKADNKGFAVIELYTSEGCSSCPPADEVVAKIEKESKDKPVYILAYHVDYWNSLGWKDVFSSADYSKRQRQYADYLHLQSVYTPQVIVNGKTEFVGSEEATLRNAIKTSLQKSAASTLDLNATTINHDEANLKYAIEGDNKNTALLIAVLQKNAQTKVARGENGGRTLSHVQIVRKLQQFAISGNNGIAKIALPAGFDSQNWEIVGFLQNTANGAVTGAAKASIGADVNTSAAIR